MSLNCYIDVNPDCTRRLLWIYTEKTSSGLLKTKSPLSPKTVFCGHLGLSSWLLCRRILKQYAATTERVYENYSVSSNMELYCHTGDKQSFSPSPCKCFNQKFYYSCLHMWLYTKNINFHVVLCFRGGMFLMHLHLCVYACTCVFKISSLRWFHSEKGKVVLAHTVHGFHRIFRKLAEVSFLSDLNSAFFLVQIVYTSYFWLWLGTVRLSRKLIDFVCVCVLALFVIKIPDCSL